MPDQHTVYKLRQEKKIKKIRYENETLKANEHAPEW
jgi:hypothetical protein